MSLQINDPSRMVYPLSTKTPSGNLISPERLSIMLTRHEAQMSGREEAYLRAGLLWPHKCYEYHATDQEQQSSQHVRTM